MATVEPSCDYTGGSFGTCLKLACVRVAPPMEDRT